MLIQAERVSATPTFVPKGPGFTLIEETTWDMLKQSGRRWPFACPLLVKGGVRNWPAHRRWSFESMADQCEADVSRAPAKFTDGLVEQGKTKGRPYLPVAPCLPVAPYLRELGKAALETPDPAAGLLPLARRQALRPGERFHLNWAHHLHLYRWGNCTCHKVPSSTA